MPLVLLAIAALLGFGVYSWESQRSLPEGPSKASSALSSALFPGLKEGDIQQLTIQTIGPKLTVERSDRGWRLREPQPMGPASEASVAFLTSLLVGNGERVLEVAPDRLREFGLDQPVATIEFRTTRSDGTQSIVLGQTNFNRSTLYAIVNPPADPKANRTLVLVSPSFTQATTRPIAEWRTQAPKTPQAPKSP